MSDVIDTTIIGAGVIGLAIAAKLARDGQSTLILEAQSAIGMQTSSRNSEVIHAGIYYPENSLKAKLSVAGKSMLYAYCEQYAVPFKRLGKIIVATNAAEEQQLHTLAQKAANNGVNDLQELSRQALQKLEPDVSGSLALLSPSTGIIDAHQLMLALLGQAESKGATLALNSKVTRITRCDNQSFELTVDTGDDEFQFISRCVINAAGLQAQAVASKIECLSQDKIPPLHPCKGSYFSLSGKSPFAHLIYPIPDKNTAGLGVHATLDLAGQVKFGPDTEYISALDYQVDASKIPAFLAAISRYYPKVSQRNLTPHFAGIRPKLQGPNDGIKDFVIRSEAENGYPNLIQLFGIESPGLTSCLAIAEYVEILLHD